MVWLCASTSQRAVRVALRAEGAAEVGAVRQAQRRIQHVEPQLPPAAGAERRDPAVPHVERRDRLLDDLHALPLQPLPLLGLQVVHRPAEGEQGHVVRVGARDETRLAGAALAVADHRDPPAARLVAVADGAVPHQAAPHRVRQVRQVGLHVDRARGEQHAPGLHPRGAPPPASSTVAAKPRRPASCAARHRAGQDAGAVPPEVVALARQDLRPRNAFGEEGDVVADRDPGGARLAGVHHREAPLEAREVEGRRQPRRTAADHQAVESAVVRPVHGPALTRCPPTRTQRPAAGRSARTARGRRPPRPAHRKGAPPPMPPSPAYRPSTRHAELGEGFFDVVDARALPAPRPALPQPALGRARRARHADRRGVDRAFRPLRAAARQLRRSRWRCATTATSSACTTPTSATAAASSSPSCATLRDGRLLDLGTKGSGQTPWSRGGDGRLTLKGGVREVLATAMLEALGVQTSKTFSLIETGEALMRDDEPSPDALLRAGAAQPLAHPLRHLPAPRLPRGRGAAAPAARPRDPAPTCRKPGARTRRRRAAAFLEAVCRRAARMGAQWMAAGFVHGVLNTDNMNITGESFDYGPWRFLPTYDPDFTAAYFDHSGLYAFGRQPEALFWNLARLGRVPAAAGRASRAGGRARRLRARAAPGVRRGRAAPARPGAARTRRGRARWSGRFFAFLRDSQAPFEQVFFDWRGGHGERGARGARAPRPRTTPRRPSRPCARPWQASRRRRTPAGPPLFRAARALHDADRGGRGDLGADRRSRRLVRLPRQAGRDRRDGRSLRHRAPAPPPP